MNLGRKGHRHSWLWSLVIPLRGIFFYTQLTSKSSPFTKLIELLTMSRSLKLEKRYVERAKVILLSDQGLVMDQITERTGLSKPVVNKWRQRFRQQGIEGLKDAPRSGKPKVITAQQQAMVIEKACTKPEGGYTNWSQERIAKEVGISQSKVFQILKQADLKPH